MSSTREYVVRVRTSWIRYGIVALITTLVVVPLTANASHQFTDVPDTNIFHDDIAWMKDNAITTGCLDGTVYCPGDNVTRQQMAAFMRRLAEKKVVDAATAVTADDAGMLGGEAPDHYETIIEGTQGTDGELLPIDNLLSDFETVSITAPAPGYVLVNYHASVLRDGFDNAVRFGIEEGAACDSVLTNDTFVYGSVDSTSNYDNVAGTAVFAVNSGTNTFTLCGHTDGNTMLLIGHGVQLTYSATGSAPGIVTGAARSQGAFWD